MVPIFIIGTSKLWVGNSVPFQFIAKKTQKTNKKKNNKTLLSTYYVTYTTLGIQK